MNVKKIWQKLCFGMSNRTIETRKKPRLNRVRLLVESLEDRMAPAIITVTPAASPTPSDNDYTRVQTAIDTTATNGDTITLAGTFDWTETNAAASWALGNDGLPSTLDDYSILVPAGLNNVTLTAASLGAATIQGPGDLPAVNLEGVFVFDGGDNQNWTISNLRIVDFDLGIGMFAGAGGTDAFNDTKILNNYIKVATDLNATAAPGESFQNIGIHYAFGTNQTIQGNTIEFDGDGLSDSGSGDFAASVGMQSNTSGGSVYDGLLIDNNTLNVLNAQSADPEVILGIWENGHAHTSDITVSNNDFNNLAAGNNPALNLQRAFRVTSHSSATTTTTYSGNTVEGANIGMQWIASGVGGFTDPVLVTGNSFSNVFTGILVQAGGAAHITGNTIDGISSGGAGVNVLGSTSKARIIGNSITGSFDGIKVDAGTALVEGNDLNKNSNAGLLIQNGGIVDAGQVGAGVNFTGLGISTGSNDFRSYKAGHAAKAIRNLNTGVPYSAPGSNGLPFDVMAQNNVFHKEDLAFIEQVVEHDVDNSALGFVNFAPPKKKGGPSGPPAAAKGNNGIGNGLDPQPPGNPPENDTSGLGNHRGNGVIR